MAKEREGTLFRPACLVFRKQFCQHSSSCRGVSIFYLGPHSKHSENRIPPPLPPTPKGAEAQCTATSCMAVFFFLAGHNPHPHPFP